MTNMIPSREKGFSLIELLVALAIGLLVTLVVMQAYLSGLGTQRAQTDLGRAQESSRFAFDLLARSLRKAGYRNPKAQGTAFCPGPNVRLVASNDPSAITSATFGTNATIVNNSDAILVRYYGEGIPAHGQHDAGLFGQYDCREHLGIRYFLHRGRYKQQQ